MKDILMLVIRPLTKIQKFITLLCGMATAAAIVISGFPEPPPRIGKVEYLLVLWLACIVIWGVLVLMIDSLAADQQRRKPKGDGGQDGRA
jgi:hypothetical protein